MALQTQMVTMVLWHMSRNGAVSWHLKRSALLPSRKSVLKNLLFLFLHILSLPETMYFQALSSCFEVEKGIDDVCFRTINDPIELGLSGGGGSLAHWAFRGFNSLHVSSSY